MKTLYLLLSFYFMSILLDIQCQEWAPIGAEWRYRTELSPTNDVWYDLIRIEKDTLITGQECRKYTIYQEFVNQETPVFDSFGFTYERNDSIFFWHQDAFYLQYDFSALSGDTITIPTPDFGYEPQTTDSFIVVLDRIKTELIGLSQTPLQKYYTHSIYGTLDYFDNGYYQTIGSKSVWGGLTTDITPVGLIFNDLRCYKDNDIEILGIDINCSYPTAYDELIEPITIRLYPNPTADYLNIFFGIIDRKNFTYIVLNSQGKQVYQLDNKFLSSNYMIKVKDWPVGQYFLKIKDGKNRLIKTYPWIKQ